MSLFSLYNALFPEKRRGKMKEQMLEEQVEGLKTQLKSEKRSHKISYCASAIWGAICIIMLLRADQRDLHYQAAEYEQKIARVQQTQQQQIEFDRKYGVLPRDATSAYLDYRTRMWEKEFGDK